MIWMILFQLLFFTSNENWFTDIDGVFLHARENNKMVLMVFAGSDWCRPCIRFKESVLTDEKFQSFAMEKVDILYLDFPAKKKNKLSKEQTAHNEKLAAQYNQSGIFPRIFLFNSEREMIKEIKYSDQSPESFISLISQ